MFSIYKKDLNAFFSNLSGYIIIAIFHIVSALFLWVIPGEYNISDSGYANADGLFRIAPWLLLFLCPAVSMSLISEEKRNGTWELLITKPVRKIELIFGKFLAAFTVVFIALLPTTIHYFMVWFIAEPVGNIDSGQFWGSFLGLIFLSSSFLSIGIFASALSKNQLIAFIIGALMSFVVFYGFDLSVFVFNSAKTIEFIQSLGINAHYQSISRGVVDSHDLSYFLLISTLFLLFAYQKIRKL